MAEAAGADDPAMRMALLLTMETLRDPPTGVLTPEARAQLERATDPFLAFRRCAIRFRDADPVNQMLLTDLSLQLPSQFLPKVDRATMAYGLEARVPLLDERVAEVAVALPSTLKVQGAGKKIILRNAMRSRLPADILDGPKTGFGVPYQYWLRHSLYDVARDAMLSSGFLNRFGLNRCVLDAALNEHRSGTRDRGFLLWKVFQLALWSRELG
jgi:asparagine synthase (glutamine-hydrolysing)